MAVETVVDELWREAASALEFLVGGQRGVDQWAARAARTRGIPFHVVLPLPPHDFTADWSSDERHQFDDLLGTASIVRVVGGTDAAASYTERNRLVAEGCGLLVAVWTGLGVGGTAETIAFARAIGTPVREVRLAASLQAANATGRGI